MTSEIINGSAVEEHALVARMRLGEEEAFAEAVRKFGPRMLAVIRRFLPGEHDAEDVLQEAFLSAFRSLDSFQENARLATWLHRIAVNAALMKLRSQKRKPEKRIDDMLPQFVGDGHLSRPATPWGAALDTAVTDRETRRVVRASIDQLPDDYRTVLLLRDIEGLSTEEAADQLGIAAGNVKTRLHRARQALKTLLDPYMQEGAP